MTYHCSSLIRSTFYEQSFKIVNTQHSFCRWHHNLQPISHIPVLFCAKRADTSRYLSPFNWSLQARFVLYSLSTHGCIFVSLSCSSLPGFHLSLSVFNGLPVVSGWILINTVRIAIDHQLKQWIVSTKSLKTFIYWVLIPFHLIHIFLYFYLCIFLCIIP